VDIVEEKNDATLGIDVATFRVNADQKNLGK